MAHRSPFAGWPCRTRSRTRPRHVDRYDDGKLLDESRDDAWIAEGRDLFERLRTILARGGLELVDWEGTWDRQVGDT